MNSVRRLLPLLALAMLIPCITAFSGLLGADVKTPDYYASAVRAMFKRGQWEQGKRLLDEGLRHYAETNDLNELNGRYYYHRKDYGRARYYLVVAVRDNPQNVEAKQLLVSVEEATGNYSSAICYVNELLEVNPYWKGLWRKKIGLFRLQGNHVEADRLLKRLHQIYPNDSAVAREYAGSIEERYLRQRGEGDLDAAAASLRELAEARPADVGSCVALANLLIRQGNTDEALSVVGRSLAQVPGSVTLAVKKASILAAQGRYQEAMAFIRQRMRHSRSAALAKCYGGLLAEAAEAARMSDPYVLYGKLYAERGSAEALDYLVGTAVTRGYDEDALYYLAEAKRRRGELPSLLYKEYTVYKRMGNTAKAGSILESLADMAPDDAGLADELAMLRLGQARRLMADGQHSEALPYLAEASARARDPEIAASALSATYACHCATGRYGDALAALEAMRRAGAGGPEYCVRKADIYNRDGRTPEALCLLDSALRADTADIAARAELAAAYEETAVPYIKRLIEDGATLRAFTESSRLLAVCPSSVEGLLYATGTAGALGRREAYDRYVAQARSFYPDRPDFIVKQAAGYSRDGLYGRALDLLRPWLDEYPGNKGMVGAYAEGSEKLAYSLVKAHDPDSAIAVADSALRFAPGNVGLMVAKGVAFEARHDYDSAYACQRKYTPGALEAPSFARHLAGLRSRSYRNEVGVEYLRGRYAEADVITSVATASYTRRERADTYTARLNYAGRDGDAAGADTDHQVPGGVGLQAQASWEHRFSARWSGEATAGVASRYFPRAMAGLKAERHFAGGVSADVHAGYRRISTYTKAYRWHYPDAPGGEGGWVFDGWDESRRHLFTLGAGVLKAWERVTLGGKADAHANGGKLYFNASAQLKYFPLADGRTSIVVSGSAGTAPEANVIDNAMPGSFDRLNTAVGLGGIYMLNSHLSVGLEGTWHTYYSQLNRRVGLSADSYSETLDTTYRNLYNIHLQLYVHF